MTTYRICKIYPSGAVRYLDRFTDRAVHYWDAATFYTEADARAEAEKRGWADPTLSITDERITQ